jgi:hypothetical protein
MYNEEQLAAAREKAAEVNKGNTYSSKSNRLLSETLNRVLIQQDGHRARMIAEALVTKAEEGDISAIKEVFDRTEGKAIARTEISGVDGSPLPLGLPIEFVKPTTDNKVSG